MCCAKSTNAISVLAPKTVEPDRRGAFWLAARGLTSIAAYGRGARSRKTRVGVREMTHANLFVGSEGAYRLFRQNKRDRLDFVGWDREFVFGLHRWARNRWCGHVLILRCQ